MNLDQWIFQVQDYITLNPQGVAIGLILGATILMVFFAIRKARNKAPPVGDVQVQIPGLSPGVTKERYEFWLCIVGDKHRWIKIVKDSLTFTFEDTTPRTAGDPITALVKHGHVQKYDIDPTVSYELDPSIGQRIGMFLRRIDAMFLVIFSEGNNKPIKYQAPTRSAYVLRTIEESTALSEGLKKEFAGDLSVKKLFMYLIIIIVGVLAYLLLTGQINMGGM